MVFHSIKRTHMVQSQFFTDDVILAAALLFFIFFMAVAILLIYWRDWEVVWVIAMLLIHLLALSYFSVLWTSPDSPIIAFPETNLLIRPYNCLMWALITTYALVRLRIKFVLRRKYESNF